MPVRDDVVLVADGGEMTVGRQLATYMFGQFQTILPDGEEQVESDSRLQNGYIYRPDNPPSGRFDVGFVRADVSIDLGAQTSDLEDVIDTAQKRVAGEVYFEREISGPGLGRHRGGVDFEISDLVWVEIWGKRLQLPVTSIEDYFDSGALSERVHVGGQIISDVAQLRRHNDGLLQQIQNERAQLLRRVEGAREEARSLVAEEQVARREGFKAAERAREFLTQEIAQQRTSADERFKELRAFLTGAGKDQSDLVAAMEGLNQQLRRNGSEPAPGLIPAYLQMNTELWQMQQEINDALTKADKALKEGQEANANLIETNRRRQQEIQANQDRLEVQSRRLNSVIADVQRRQPQFIAFASNSGGTSSLGAISINSGNIVFSKSGSWSGNVAIFAWVDAILAYPIASQIFLSSSEREKEFRVGAFESVKAGLAIIVPD